MSNLLFGRSRWWFSWEIYGLQRSTRDGMSLSTKDIGARWSRQGHLMEIVENSMMWCGDVSGFSGQRWNGFSGELISFLLIFGVWSLECDGSSQKYEWWKRKATYDEGRWSDDKVTVSWQQGDGITRIRMHMVKWRVTMVRQDVLGESTTVGMERRFNVEGPLTTDQYTHSLVCFFTPSPLFSQPDFFFYVFSHSLTFFGLQKTTCPENTVATPNAQVGCLDVDSLPVSFCGDCLFVVGTNIQRTAKIIGQTAKIAITTEGLGGTEPFLSRSLLCDIGLRKI